MRNNDLHNPNLESDRESKIQNPKSKIGSLVWEIPLAILSFFFYKAMKFVIGNLYTIYLAINKKNASQWRVLSAETLKSPLSLPVLMTKGPRWNTHAIIGTLGPFSVKDAIAIDTESANASARSWIAVIYSFPGYETITSLESEKLNSTDKWVSLKLKPGQYSIGLRYYNRADKITFPAIKLGDCPTLREPLRGTDSGKAERELVASTQIPSNINDFYDDLIQKKSCFYLALHYYIFTILRLRKWLPEYFVKNEYLPVGAPDTAFFYGHLWRGQSLQVESEPVLVKNYDIYLTVYDRSSLPLCWSQLEQEKYLTQSIENNGFYLIRMRPKPSLTDESLKELAIASKLNDEDSLVRRLQILAQ
ncbi:MAG: DUF6208 family protein [Hydrococcus sp. Prado102]|jgi:hypothetical protein|nr:DUF6208 family protein [Hydrococcus sp. Prado102]